MKEVLSQLERIHRCNREAQRQRGRCSGRETWVLLRRCECITG
jgi:hypothetical protein